MASHESPPTTSLPPELYDEVLEHLPRKVLLQVAQSSRSLRQASTRILYRDVCLHDTYLITRCFETLIENDTAAQSVRKLALTIHDQEPLPPQYLRHLQAGFARVSQNVTDLCIMAEYRDIFASITVKFPQLRYLASSQRISSGLLSFLRSHRSLAHIELYNSADCPMIYFAEPLDLPRLEHIYGPARLVEAVVPGAPVCAIGIAPSSFDPYDSGMERRVISAIAHSHVRVTSLTFWYPLRVQDVLLGISQWLRDLEELNFHGVPLWDGNLPVLLGGIQLVLQQCHSLRKIELTANHPPSPMLDSVKYEHELLIAWSKIQPSLEVAFLPTGLWWAKTKMNGSWIPVVTSIRALEMGPGREWWLQNAVSIPELTAIMYTLAERGSLRFAEFLQSNFWGNTTWKKDTVVADFVGSRNHPLDPYSISR
ncbi:hypothetical protein NLJ89_g7704 [Agrocybe chaxingu]|uniref:F-box domain-containing protein n=1 Tax=Agrocybe chaxingu TaxID=84603 RepID=A0A9W8MRH7_9AGAR|nr:hypothetical protein NLJ89_g7704 [Agrocybe chaxingu]